MNTWRDASLAVAAAAPLTLTTACGQEQGDASPRGRAVGNAAPAQQPADSGYGSAGGGYGSGAGADAAEPKEAGQLAVQESRKLGKVLTDSEGFTLYRFDKDTANPPKSTCDGACVVTWPVVSAGNAAAAAGTDPELLGEVTRADGTSQLTVDGRPMYRYAKDTAPGQVNGQGVGGTWFAAARREEGGEERRRRGRERTGRPRGAFGPQGPGTRRHRGGRPGYDGLPLHQGHGLADEDRVHGRLPQEVAGSGSDGQERGGRCDDEGIRHLDRPDGVEQQTIACWPIHTFAGDAKPGDTNGQGVGGTWYAVSPDSKLIGASR